MKLTSRILNLIEMALSPSDFIEEIRKNSLEPAFNTYMKQYLVDTYNLHSEVNGHNWMPEAQRLLALSVKLYNKSVSFNKRSKKAKFIEAISDTSPEGQAFKAKTTLLNILNGQKKKDKKKIKALENFDTTSEDIQTLFIAFLKDNLPLPLSNFV
jgi:hypothetical protein